MTQRSVPRKMGHGAVIFSNRWVLLRHLGVLPSHEKAKVARNLTNWLSRQYLKKYASELLTQGSVSRKMWHGAVIFSYRWVLLGRLGVLQSHEKAKIARNVINWPSIQYLKGYASEPLTWGSVASRR